MNRDNPYSLELPSTTSPNPSEHMEKDKKEDSPAIKPLGGGNLFQNQKRKPLLKGFSSSKYSLHHPTIHSRNNSLSTPTHTFITTIPPICTPLESAAHAHRPTIHSRNNSPSTPTHTFITTIPPIHTPLKSTVRACPYFSNCLKNLLN